MPLSFEMYEEKIQDDPRIVGPPHVIVEPEKADSWELVPRYTFRWTNIEDDRFAEPTAPGTGETVRSPVNERPLKLYTEEEQEAYREAVADTSVTVNPATGNLDTQDAWIRDQLLYHYDDDLEAVRANHVEVVPYRLAIVPAQEAYTSCR